MVAWLNALRVEGGVEKWKRFDETKGKWPMLDSGDHEYFYTKASHPPFLYSCSAQDGSFVTISSCSCSITNLSWIILAPPLPPFL